MGTYPLEPSSHEEFRNGLRRFFWAAVVLVLLGTGLVAALTERSGLDGMLASAIVVMELAIVVTIGQTMMGAFTFGSEPLRSMVRLLLAVGAAAFAITSLRNTWYALDVPLLVGKLFISFALAAIWSLLPHLRR